MAMSKTKAECRCGQVLLVGTHDMSAWYRCPRCGFQGTGGDLVSAKTPLHAIPVDCQPSSPPPIGQFAFSGDQANPHQPPVEAEEKQCVQLPISPVPVEQWAGSNPRLQSSPRTLGGFLRWVAYGIEGHVFSPWRKGILLIAALTVYLASLVDTLAYAVALVGFSVVTYLMIIVHIWAITDKNGNWSAGAVREWLGELLKSASGWARELNQTPGWYCAVLVGGWLFGVGLVVGVPLGALRMFLEAASIETGGFIGLAFASPILLMAFGSLLCMVGVRFRPRRATLRQVAEATDLSSALARYPAAIDVWNLPPLALRTEEERWLGGWVDVLRTWVPRNCRNERDYEMSLTRHLLRNGYRVDGQRRIALDDGAAGRLDLVVNGRLAVELKCEHSQSAYDRAVGQVWKYLCAWKRGPVVLLFCETTSDFAGSGIARRITELRNLRSDVALIAAGRRLTN